MLIIYIKYMKYLYYKENTFKPVNETSNLLSITDKSTKKPVLVNLINDARHYPASNKEWINSIYSYNKASIKSLPVKDKLIYILLKSYFNLKKNKIKGVASSTRNLKRSAFMANNLNFSSLAKKRLKDRNLSFLTRKAKDNNKLYLLKEWDLARASQEKQKLLLSNNKLSEQNKLALERVNSYSNKYLLLRKQRFLKRLRIKENKKKNFLKKTFISLPEIKHLNNKSIITVSIYNRNNLILKKKIYKLYKMFIYKKKKKLSLLNHIKYGIIKAESKSLNLIELLNLFPENTKYLNRNKYSLINYLRLSLYKRIYAFFKHGSGLTSQKRPFKKVFALFNNKSFDLLFNKPFAALLYDIKKVNLRKLKKIKKVIKRKYKKLLKYKYFVMLLCFYKFRLNNSNLLGLKNIIRKMYGKKIVFRIINLKYMYLDSNIIAEAITKKLRDRKKRILRILKSVIKNIKKVSLVENLWAASDASHKENINYTSNRLDSFASLISRRKIYNKTPINLISSEDLLAKSKDKQKKEIRGVILYNLNNKIVTGIKLQGSGRLTKRLTASRSVTKFRNKGTLKNINSSFKSISTIMLRGYFKSNLQYININSYNRNGSFGIKSWVSSY